jgi:perosamine synthetase
LGYYKNRFNIDQNNYPGARDANNNSMAIPLHNKMTHEDYSYVINELKAIK